MAAFGQAEQYQQFAVVQRQVAHRLAAALPPLAPCPVILELGCGTGLLSRQLLARWPDTPFVCSDIALPMVQRCRQQLGQRETVLYTVLDGEQPAVIAAGFDLIAASMVFQWFSRPLAALAGLHALLRPGGCLAFATLGPATFMEWQQGCTALGLTSGLPSYPPLAAWQQAWPNPELAQLQVELVRRRHRSGLAFLQELRAVGAHQPVEGYRPQTPGQLRRLLRHLEQENGEVTMTYQVLYGLFYKKSF
ncbi:MAG: methyltransferase [Magnetococcales bacterium]|nr:methyltransferase [Magnetococcales bacterium]